MLLAIAFDEEDAAPLAATLNGFTRLVFSSLLEAELRAACHRESRAAPAHLLARISWVLTHRALSMEMETALSTGHLRGADLWHIATALSVAPEPAAIAFVTADQRQAEVAAAAGVRGPRRAQVLVGAIG